MFHVLSLSDSYSFFIARLSGKLRTEEEGADTVIWLALQPKENLESGEFYFDRAKAAKHLPFVGTRGSDAQLINSIISKLRFMAGLVS